LAFANAAATRWLWYAIRTKRCVPLDANAYPTTVFARGTIPWPTWACKTPEGGVHLNGGLGRIDVHVAKAPQGPEELHWTCDFGVFLVADSWLAEIADLVERDGVSLGQLSLSGRPLSGWSTIHDVDPPTLLASDGRTHTCPFCGWAYTVTYGRVYFSDPTIDDRSLVVNRNGIFVREDLAIMRNLRTPVGAYKPSAVKLRTG
jgi:hypothetical protein